MSPVLPLAAVFAMLASATGLGSAILRILRAAPEPVERLLTSLVIGLAAQATVLLALAALGWMHPAALWSAVLLPALLLGREREVFVAGYRELRALFAEADPVERAVAVAVTAAVTLILLVGALGPVMDWDSLMYHVQLPRQYLDAGRLYLPPDGQHTAFLGLFQFLYLPLLAIGAASGPALLSAAMALALGVAVTTAAARIFGRHAGLLAGVALWGSSSLLIVAMTPRVDVTLILALFLAHYAVILALRGEAPWGITVAALTAGVAVGIKYHALPYVAALVPFALWALWRQAPAALPRRATLALALSLGVAAPWLLKNQVLYGAPFYPFFAERLAPPFIAEIQGHTGHPPSLSTDVYRGLGRAREPISLRALLLRPEALTVESEATAYTRNPALYLAPLAVFLLRDRTILALLVPAALYLAVTLGYFARTNLRYLMPVIPVMLLASVGVLQRLGPRWSPVARRRVLIVLAALSTLPALRVAGTRTLTPLRLQVAIGLQPPEALLAGDLSYAVAAWFNANTPYDAKILMLFDARGLYHERATIQDNVLTNWPLLVGTGATERCLAGTGITHVYLNRAILNYYATRGLDPAMLEWNRFPEFATRCLEPLADVNGVEIYRVR